MNRIEAVLASMMDAKSVTPEGKEAVKANINYLSPAEIDEIKKLSNGQTALDRWEKFVDALEDGSVQDAIDAETDDACKALLSEYATARESTPVLAKSTLPPATAGFNFGPKPLAPPATPAHTTTRTTSPTGAGEGGHMADNTTPPTTGDARTQGDRNKNKGGQHVDAIALALLQKAEEDRKAKEAEARAETAKAEAKKAEEDRKTAEAKKATAEAEAKKTEIEEVYKQRDAARKKADKIDEEFAARMAMAMAKARKAEELQAKAADKIEKGFVAESSVTTPVSSPPVPPAPKSGVTITIGSAQLGWIVAILGFVLFLTFQFWGSDDKPSSSVRDEKILEQRPAEDPAVKASKDLEEAEVKIRASCVRLKYADKTDAPRCDQIVERYMKMKGIDK